MPETKAYPLRVHWDGFIADRTQFKQYSPAFRLENVYVTIPVPSSEVSFEGEEITLTLEGFTAVLSVVAAKLDEMHEEWRERYEKEQKEKAKEHNQKSNRGGGGR